MGTYPNVATQFRSGKEAVEAGRKGGLVKSEKKKIGQFYRTIKHYGADYKFVEKVVAMLDNPQFSAMYIYRNIDILENLAKENPKIMPLVVDLQTKWHNMVHKKDIHVNQTNIQNNNNINGATVNIVVKEENATND